LLFLLLIAGDLEGDKVGWIMVIDMKGMKQSNGGGRFLRS